MPKVSIIVPNYNHVNYLTQRLESIFNQTFQDFEIILLDDCSSDASIEILQEYSTHPQVSHFIINSDNSGSTFKQWNKGFAVAQGEYIWIAESDDWADITFLEKLVPILESNQNVGIALTQSYKTNINSEIKEKIDYGYHDYSFTNDIAIVLGKNFIIEKMLEYNGIPNASALLFRKDLLVKVGFADETNRLFSDWLQWIKFLLVSDIAIYNLYLNYYREHQDTVRHILTRKEYYSESFEFYKELNFINKNQLKSKIPNSFFNQKLRDVFHNIVKLQEIPWKESVMKSLVLLQVSFSLVNIFVFLCCLIHSRKVEIFLDRKAMVRIKNIIKNKLHICI